MSENLLLGSESLTIEAKELTEEIYEWMAQKLNEGSRPVPLMAALKLGVMAAEDPQAYGIMK